MKVILTTSNSTYLNFLRVRFSFIAGYEQLVQNPNLIYKKFSPTSKHFLRTGTNQPSQNVGTPYLNTTQQATPMILHEIQYVEGY
jgi:hypothetical protein